MTGKVINLRAVRKAKAREAARQQGDENATLHGRTKAQIKEERDTAERANRHLDGHRRDDGPEE